MLSTGIETSAPIDQAELEVEVLPVPPPPAKGKDGLNALGEADARREVEGGQQS
jgi:hypothetical protein